MIGKIIGGLIGMYLLRSGWGMLIGMLLGHMLYDAPRKARRPAPHQASSFIAPLFAFAGALAKSDGRVSEREIAAAEALMTRLQLDQEQRREAISAFNRGKEPGFPSSAAIAELRAWCRGRRDLAWLQLDLLLDLVFADGPLPPGKRQLLLRLCAALGVSQRELGALAAMKGHVFDDGVRGQQRPSGGYSGRQQRSTRPGPAAGHDPYQVLGVGRDSSDRDIKTAWRRLMSQHHPDKLGNVPETLKQRAGERAREINAAYEQIKSARGFT